MRSNRRFFDKRKSNNTTEKTDTNTSSINSKLSLTFETIKKIVLSFYPEEDEYFFNLIFSPNMNINSFYRDLIKFYKNIKSFSDDDPENKFYGVQNLTKIPKNRDKIETIELNKYNTDLIFVLVRDILLASYDEEIDKKSLIKSKINEIFNCNTLNSISFISSKLDNYTSLFPVNFYAFCVTIKILLMCYPQQIKNFHMGIFMETQLTLFDKKNNECFLSELFCCYLTFLYLSSNILKDEVSTLCLHFWEDSNIFDTFSFHISNNGYIIVKNKLPKMDSYDILSLLKELFHNIIYRISIYLHYNISLEIYEKITQFLNYGDFPKKINLFCSRLAINNKHFNFYKDITNCKELNIQVITNNSLVNSNAENTINLKEEENENIKNFSLEGINIYIEKMPNKMSAINSLKLISNKRSYYLEDEKEYKKLHDNICFNFQNEFFFNLKYLEELTLKHITPEQFFTLVNCLHSTNNMNQSSILKLYVEINYSHIKILNNIDNGISKTDILRSVDSLIRNCKRIVNIRQLEIILSNNNPQNNLLLTKENGFYFISTVLEILKKCYIFSLKNFNIYYYPLNEVKPDIKPRTTTGRRSRTFRGKNFENITVDEEFSLQDDVHQCNVISNLNKDLQVIYNGCQCNDIAFVFDLKKALPFLYVVKKRMTTLKPKAILINIVKFFEIGEKSPKQYSVCNFNN